MQRDRGGIEAFFRLFIRKGTSIFFPRSWKEGNCAEARVRSPPPRPSFPRSETRKRRHNTEPISSLFLHANASDAKHERGESKEMPRPSDHSIFPLFVCVRAVVPLLRRDEATYHNSSGNPSTQTATTRLKTARPIQVTQNTSHLNDNLPKRQVKHCQLTQ